MPSTILLALSMDHTNQQENYREILLWHSIRLSVTFSTDKESITPYPALFVTGLLLRVGYFTLAITTRNSLHPARLERATFGSVGGNFQIGLP